MSSALKSLLLKVLYRRCRVLCRALVAFIHTQLPENKSSRKQYIRQEDNAPGGFSSNDK